MSPQLSLITEAARLLNELICRIERSAERESELIAEIKQLRSTRMLNREQMAQKFGVKPATISYYERKGLLPHRIGDRLCLWSEAEVDAWMMNTPISFHRKG